MNFKKFLNEKNYIKFNDYQPEVYSAFSLSIVEDSFNELFPKILSEDVDSLIDNYLNVLNEDTAANIPSGSKVVFGRVIKDHEMIGKIDNGKFVPVTINKGQDGKPIKVEKDDIDNAPAHVKNIYKRLKKEVHEIADHLSVSHVAISTALAQDTNREVLKSFHHSFKAIGKAAHKTFSLIDTTLRQSFVEIEKAGGLDKLKKGTQKIDQFLNENPKIKKMGGPLVVGALYYQWQNMSFSGNFNEDFDVTPMVSALAGDYKVENLVATAAGAKALTQFAIGLTTGISFPWTGGFSLAMIYTGAKHAKNTDLAKKTLDKLKELKNSTGLPAGAEVIFGKVVLDGKQIGVMEDGKFIKKETSSE